MYLWKTWNNVSFFLILSIRPFQSSGYRLVMLYSVWVRKKKIDFLFICCLLCLCLKEEYYTDISLLWACWGKYTRMFVPRFPGIPEMLYFPTPKAHCQRFKLMSYIGVQNIINHNIPCLFQRDWYRVSRQ